MLKSERILDRLLTRLAQEEKFLSIPYYTWWFEYDRLELFQPFESLIPRAMWSEWEEFVVAGGDPLINSVERYNLAGRNLEESCRTLQLRLQNSSTLKGLYNECINDPYTLSLGLDEATLFGSRWPEGAIPYLAQLIVNATPADCSPLYTIRPFWLHFADRFHTLTRSDEFKPYADDRDKNGGDTLRAIKDLLQILYRFQPRHVS